MRLPWWTEDRKNAPFSLLMQVDEADQETGAYVQTRKAIGGRVHCASHLPGEMSQTRRSVLENRRVEMWSARKNTVTLTVTSVMNP